jgi:hypothetical protein
MNKEQVDKLAREFNQHLSYAETCMRILIAQVDGDAQQMDYELKLERALVEVELVLAGVRRKLEEERAK